MTYNYAGTVALVTGGANGIGRATSIAFAHNGATVVVSDIDEEEGKNTVNHIKSNGGQGVFIKCDVSKVNEVQALMENIVDAYGQLNYAFNNAGIEGKMATTGDCTEENWDLVIGINLKGTWLCMKYEIPHMLRQGSGSIINCSSVAGLVGFRQLPAYSASKHGLVGLTKAAALEYSKKGIRINAVCPGVIRTPMIDRVTGKDPEMERKFTDLEPIGRLGEPEEIAESVLWLCSDSASFITGVAFPVDGGFVAQ